MGIQREIGGFFDLSLPFNDGAEYHTNALRLNSGRNAFLYILKSKRVKKLYLPLYICDSILDTIDDSFIEIEYYHINENMAPVQEFNLGKNEYLLYVNYFGINRENVYRLLKKYDRVIVDNTQAFYYFPFGNEPTFYSPRKFFGVADGAYLYIDTILKESLEKDYSFDRYEHLLKRVELPANETYNIFIGNEEKLNKLPLKKMSRLTSLFLQNIDYDSFKVVRESNFNYYHTRLRSINKLNIDIRQLNGPMVYPLLCVVDGLKEFLIENKIYIPTYWNDVLKRITQANFEYKMVKYLFPLPIDQRYNSNDLDRIVKLIEKYLSNQKK